MQSKANETREEKKRKAIEKLDKSKDKLIAAATDIYKSLNKIVRYKKEEVAEELLASVKAMVDKMEKKNKSGSK